MESNEDSKPVQAIREGFPVEHEVISRARKSRSTGVWCRSTDSHPTGRVICEAAGAIPADEFILIQIADRETRSVALDERVDLREVDRLRFRVFRDDRAFTFTLDGRGFEWGSDSIPAVARRDFAEIDTDFELVLRHEAGVVIPDDSEIALSKSHVAVRLFTRRRQPELITIVINGRARQVKGPKISFSEVVALAFPTRRQGPKGSSRSNTSAALTTSLRELRLRGRSVKIKKGMEFDVTPTNRS